MRQLIYRVIPVLMLTLLLAGNLAKPTAATSVSEYCAGSVEQEFLVLINTYRAQKGLGALAMSQTLGAAAKHKALDMATTGSLTHTLSDGTDWLANIINHGYPYGYRTENIAWGYGTPQSVFDAWRASAAHNSNMLNSGFGAIGISRVYDVNAPYRYYWATTFGSQLDTPATLCAGTTTTTVPTKTPTPRPSNTPTPQPTSTPSQQSITTPSPQPTNTSTPRPTTTSTPPSTNTPTPRPTTTSTPPSTNTPTPRPTTTSTPQPTSTPTLNPPASPTNLSASGKTQLIQLSWRDKAGNETGFRVYRSSDRGASWQVIADSLAANTTKYQDQNGLVRGQTYQYYVVAYNASGDSAPSNTTSARSR